MRQHNTAIHYPASTYLLFRIHPKQLFLAILVQFELKSGLETVGCEVNLKFECLCQTKKIKVIQTCTFNHSSASTVPLTSFAVFVPNLARVVIYAKMCFFVSLRTLLVILHLNFMLLGTLQIPCQFVRKNCEQLMTSNSSLFDFNFPPVLHCI